MRKNRKDLTEMRREIIMSLMEENWTICDIARLLRLSRQQTYNIIGSENKLDKKNKYDRIESRKKNNHLLTDGKKRSIIEVENKLDKKIKDMI